MAGLLAMASALTVVGVEMVLRTRGAGHSHSHGESWAPISTSDDLGIYSAKHNGSTEVNGYRNENSNDSYRPHNIIALANFDEASQRLVDGGSSVAESSPQENGQTISKKDIEAHDDRDSDMDLDLEEFDPSSNLNPALTQEPPLSTLTSHAERKKLMLQCIMLEAGILFHSIFIGMAISVATGTAFVVFLTAIAFHQCFEGIALGSRIANIHFPRSSLQPWLMVLAYGMTTPIGQAVGLIVHNLYDPQSKTGLLMVGIMNAISAGLLLFAGLVQLLAEDFLTDKSYKILTGRRRVHAFAAVCGGAALMALVGAWA